MEAMSGRSAGAVALPLQFRSTSPGIEIGTGSPNTTPPGWVDQKDAEVQRNLLIEGAFSGVEECPLHALQSGPSGQLSYSRSTPGSLATIDDGSTFYRRLGAAKGTSGTAKHVVHRGAKGPQYRNRSKREENQQQRILDQILAFFIVQELL